MNLIQVLTSSFALLKGTCVWKHFVCEVLMHFKSLIDAGNRKRKLSFGASWKLYIFVTMQSILHDEWWWHCLTAPHSQCLSPGVGCDWRCPMLLVLAPAPTSGPETRPPSSDNIGAIGAGAEQRNVLTWTQGFYRYFTWLSLAVWTIKVKATTWTKSINKLYRKSYASSYSYPPSRNCRQWVVLMVYVEQTENKLRFIV